MIELRDPPKSIRHFKITDRVVPRVNFCVFEISVIFGDGVMESEHVHPDDVLDRANLWNHVKGQNAAWAKGKVTASALGLKFPWPTRLHNYDLPVESFEVYYYDVYGEKRYTEMEF